LSTEVAQSIDEIETLENTLTDLNTENDSLQFQTAFLSVELESEEQYSDSLTTEVAQSIDEIETLEHTLTALNLENDSLQLQTAFLSVELESEEQYSDSLSTEVAQSIDEIETLENTLTDLNTENDSLYEELDSLQAALTLLLLNDSLHQESNTINEVEIPLFLPQGWGMFGYTCVDPMSVVDAFIPIADRVILIKDYNGEIYFPEFNFNGLGNLIYSRGYQSYLSEEVFDFSICPTLLAE